MRRSWSYMLIATLLGSSARGTPTSLHLLSRDITTASTGTATHIRYEGERGHHKSWGSQVMRDVPE
jgi:hypothetical protein